jgi:outer membrane protein
VFQEVVGFLPGTLEAPPALGGLPANEQEVIAAARDDNPAVLSARFAEQAARHQRPLRRTGRPPSGAGCDGRASAGSVLDR